MKRNETFKVLTVFDPRYCTNAAATTSTRKQIEVVKIANQLGLLKMAKLRKVDFASTLQDIATVHDPKYVKAVWTGFPRKKAESQGFHWSTAFAQSVVRIWAGHQHAADLALKHGMVFHPVSGAHHAGYTYGSGFCTFNYLIGTGRYLMEKRGLKRVGVIDLDAHHGNGTLKLSDDRFTLFDINQGLWCSCKSTKKDMFFPVEDAYEYMHMLEWLTYWLDENKPELVQYQAGMDCYEQDYVGHIKGMTPQKLAERDRLVIHEVRKRGIPLVVNVAGGYVSDGTSVSLHVQTVKIMQEELKRQAVLKAAC